jgi:hypothetical protein
MITSYTTAFWLAVLSGVIAGAVVGGIRTGRNSNGDGTFTLAWVCSAGSGPRSSSARSSPSRQSHTS